MVGLSCLQRRKHAKQAANARWSKMESSKNADGEESLSTQISDPSPNAMVSITESDLNDENMELEGSKKCHMLLLNTNLNTLVVTQASLKQVGSFSMFKIGVVMQSRNGCGFTNY